MIIKTEYVDIPVEGKPMRTFISAPKLPGEYPGILFYSDIFQLTGPTLRSCMRLADMVLLLPRRRFTTASSHPVL
jgi:carboxymethylenebutenolidase